MKRSTFLLTLLSVPFFKYFKRKETPQDVMNDIVEKYSITNKPEFVIYGDLDKCLVGDLVLIETGCDHPMNCIVTGKEINFKNNSIKTFVKFYKEEK